MSNLTIQTFSQQGNSVPQKVLNHRSDLVTEIHEVPAGSTDSVFMFVHNTGSTSVAIDVFQSNTPHVTKTMFKHISVDPAGSPMQLLFNGFTMFSGQRLYLATTNVAHEGLVRVTGYVKRFA
jgi:hypothetical protein